jgi:hypothetical protein
MRMFQGGAEQNIAERRDFSERGNRHLCPPSNFDTPARGPANPPRAIIGQFADASQHMS